MMRSLNNRIFKTSKRNILNNIIDKKSKKIKK